ncbi:FAD:protein FMN transferase [Cellulomonas soli]|uniref:FAD:protein FMN transferase n=1 Tax=Cellulomonas soli TaxID=931535 RepID=A0A512PEH1_9CELL|nr:FAD:protein FMN transferase [Cellulomonas soli]NYI58907.1 thiamine biosynthesis lipoprotein [Cellulomonas soli]GEP69600.1 FAD:protein FMN transferase [Cellulomonas soli]
MNAVAAPEAAPVSEAAPAPTVDRTFASMASAIRLSVVRPGPTADARLDRAEQVVRAVATHCTRFEATSALSRANLAPDAWHAVPAELAAAIDAAAQAHRATDGLFDPRVLRTLQAWGDDGALEFADHAPRPVVGSSPTGAVLRPAEPDTSWVGTRWEPQVVVEAGLHLVHLGGWAVDLGGIGKGLAVRWAADALAGAGAGHLVDAGGDLALAGAGPDGGAWKVGVEDPLGGEDPVLVLALPRAEDAGTQAPSGPPPAMACATSSTRRRRWTVDGTPVHHLVDPRTARPGGRGLAAVTVVASDPAWAEVWSKALFLSGAQAVREQAEDRGLAAAWVTADGTVGTSSALDPVVVWRCGRA